MTAIESNDLLRVSMNAFALTPEISELRPEIRYEIFEGTRRYTTFTPETDPAGDHSAGAFTTPSGYGVSWMIETLSSPAPRSDMPPVVHRNLSIKLDSRPEA